ncbi:CPBP family intramembrane metalloprotease [Neolewinella lacunae]|uniref:CPBP family intramembrane metalloprotease n=1 Tax=Neolewinella lacunae TaxID=1517758 RepID=A0A923PM60_9BACT|nr:CPBP family intramembrane glutamic endopeptidase [Neolewinella lacunae]MBC6995984.1 CPBP family intramembrane metalloprotease [Neolewinella lacunae]MDN3633158.1 CPBP family intramembrane metalloprotease [Neolewinella lacunae]
MREINKDLTKPGRLLLITLVALLLFALVSTVLASAVMVAAGINPLSVSGENLTVGQRQAFRLALLCSNLFLFVGTALAAFVFAYRGGWRRAAGLDRGPQSSSLAYAIGFFVLSLPVVAYLAYLNLQVDLPEWAVQTEDRTNQLLAGVLTMSSIPEVLMALVTVALTPALGEELLLRGLVQRRIFGQWFRSHHLAIWLAAFLFSFMHFEFAGFLPRLALGVTLGYSYHWTRSLWVPIGLHFAFNGLQVMVAYVTGEFTPDTQMADVPPWWLAIVSLVIVGYLGWRAETLFAPPTATEDA